MLRVLGQAAIPTGSGGLELEQLCSVAKDQVAALHEEKCALVRENVSTGGSNTTDVFMLRPITFMY